MRCSSAGLRPSPTPCPRSAVRRFWPLAARGIPAQVSSHQLALHFSVQRMAWHAASCPLLPRRATAGRPNINRLALRCRALVCRSTVVPGAQKPPTLVTQARHHRADGRARHLCASSVCCRGRQQDAIRGRPRPLLCTAPPPTAGCLSAASSAALRGRRLAEPPSPESCASATRTGAVDIDTSPNATRLGSKRNAPWPPATTAQCPRMAPLPAGVRLAKDTYIAVQQ
jgi:hypothetical protein